MTPDHPITIAEIQRAVCAEFRIGIADMKCRSRRRVVARPRQVAMYLARKLTALSLTQIARHFGKDDHTTVLYACQIVAARIATDHDLAAAVLRVIDAIAANTSGKIAA